jgi:hypothetical protein
LGIPQAENSALIDWDVAMRALNSLNGVPETGQSLAIAKEIQGTDSQLGVMATNCVAWIDAAKISKECLAPSVSISALRAYGRQHAY